MNETSKASLSWLFKMAAEHKLKLWFSMVFAGISSVISLAPYVFVFLLLEQLISGEMTLESAWPLVASAIGCMLLRYLLLLCSLLLSHKAAFAIQYHVRTQALAHMAKLPLGYFTSRSSGKVKKILSEDIDRVELFVAHHIPDLVSAILSPLMVFIFLLFIDVRMALISLIPLPLAILIQVIMYRGFEKKTEAYHQSLEQLNTTVTEYMKAMPVIRAFNAGDKPNKQLSQSLGHYHKLVDDWIQDAGWPFAFFKTLLDSGLVVLLPAGVWFWSQGTLDIPSLVLCILLGVGMMEPLYNLTLLSGYLSQIFEGVKRLQNLLSASTLPEPEVSKSIQTTDVRFENVSFKYDENLPNVIDNVSFSASKGTVTAIVGPSGAGKSTLALLLARFHDVTSGRIKLGDVDIRDLSRQDLMENVSFVFQDSTMLSLSVKDNIAMGAVADQKEIESAAKAAQAHEFICSLPNGYDTVIGESTNLSGGEKQRIAIARAILKNAPILILDEATAYADANNQAQIQHALNALIADKTVFVIAHRLSTIVDANQILVMEQGKLVGAGKHSVLIEQCKTYRAMWTSHEKSQDWSLSTQSQKSEQATESKTREEKEVDYYA